MGRIVQPNNDRGGQTDELVKLGDGALGGDTIRDRLTIGKSLRGCRQQVRLLLSSKGSALSSVYGVPLSRRPGLLPLPAFP